MLAFWVSSLDLIPRANKALLSPNSDKYFQESYLHVILGHVHDGGCGD